MEQVVTRTVLVKGNYRIRKKMNANQKENHNQMQKLSRLFEYLQNIKDEEMTGYIKINISQGNICKVEKYEEILKK